MTDLSSQSDSIRPIFAEGTVLGALFTPSEQKRGKPCRFAGRQVAWILSVLVLLTIVPRAVMAYRQPAACDDGYYYLWVASMWEQGRPEQALRYLNVNIYPLIIWGLHRLGLEWTAAGAVWNVVVSGLTVLPLFFLIRRMFDDRIAVVGCAMFAIHPEFIETSAEPIREPTFWFFLVLSLYLCYRAACAERLGFATFASGIAVAAAVHTRTEGWLLVPAAIWWCLICAPKTVTLTRRLMRTGVMLFMLPAFLFMINVTILSNHDHWEWGRFTPVRNFIEWVRADRSPERVEPITIRPQSESSPKSNNTASASPSVAAKNAIPNVALANSPHASKLKRRSRSVIQRFVSELGQSLEYINLICLAVGFAVLRKRAFNRELIPFSLIFWSILLAVWVRLIQIGNFNGRYFLSAYFLALPTIAVGALQLLRWFEDFLYRFRRSTAWRQIAFMVPVLGLTAGFWIDAFTTHHTGREQQVALGKWLHNQYGPFEHVVTDSHSARVGYFARKSIADVAYYDAKDIPDEYAAGLVILCPLPGQQPNGLLLERAKQAGLTLIPQSEFPPELTGYYVFRRERAAAGKVTASRSGRTDRHLR